MTRDDVAHLVIRTFALWLGATSLATLGSAPWMMPGPGGLGAIAMIALIFLGVAAVVWFAAPSLTRAMFARPDRDVPFALSTRGVPALASFVTGLVVLAMAVPQAMSWVAMQWMRSHASLLNPDLLPSLDLQSAGIGAEIVARLIVGVVLIAISRRPGLWATSAIGDVDDAGG
jgi:hypothetical protein